MPSRRAGDLLFHIRAKRMDLCFELATQIMARLGGAVTTVEEVHGFRYFDDRDLLGFVDGTENPRGQEVIDAVLIGDEDPAFAGGSYVITQKYLHDMDALERALDRGAGAHHRPQEAAATSSSTTASSRRRRTTRSPPSPRTARSVAILRDNMPFGQVGAGEFGTYFIGYCRTPRITEQMIENMFVGRPPGNYDRLLDFSRAVTGTLFFVPSASFLDDVTRTTPRRADTAPHRRRPTPHNPP